MVRRGDDLLRGVAVVTPEQKAALVNAQAAAMLAELESMKAANVHRAMQGFSQAYGEDAFLHLIDKYLVGWNAISDFFNS